MQSRHICYKDVSKSHVAACGTTYGPRAHTHASFRSCTFVYDSLLYRMTNKNAFNATLMQKKFSPSSSYRSGVLAPSRNNLFIGITGSKKINMTHSTLGINLCQITQVISAAVYHVDKYRRGIRARARAPLLR